MSTIYKYNQLADFFSKKGLKLGLMNIQKMDALFGFPSKQIKTIHVGGTNGKGSVSTKISASLKVKGKKVGLYTSPHISSFRERIKINQEMIGEEEALDRLLEIMLVLKKHEISATFFECMTMLAFLYFAEKKIDMAVFEVGLGGRFDATNIIEPIFAVVTGIELDHTRFLGSSLEEIAYEKAGIIKEKTPILVGPKAAPFSAFREEAKLKHAPYYSLEQVFENYEEENRKIAESALRLLPLEWDPSGLEVTPSCRFEQFEREIPIILDVAHNPGGFHALFKRCGEMKIHLLLALGEEKEIEPILEICSQKADFITLTCSRNPKAADPSKLAGILQKMNFPKMEIFPSPKEGFQAARKRALIESATLCVTGTFYIMGEVRRELGLDEPCDPILFSPY